MIIVKFASMKDLRVIASRFAIEGEVKYVGSLGEGLINDTYLVKTKDGNPDYVLQRVNHNVFKDVEGMQRNIEAVTNHIREKLVSTSEHDIDRKVLEFVKVKGSEKTYYVEEGEYWRVSKFIKDAITLQEVTPVTARHAGVAFGRFQNMLSDLSTPLSESILDFHNMEFRLRQLDEAVMSDRSGRVREVSDILKEIDTRRDLMCQPEKLYREGRLPKRICHCDTKVNNMLFDRNGEVLCVIDLDTVMPSFVFSDYGDFLRTGACTAPEDEVDPERVDFDLDIFRAFTEGYLSEARSFLTEEELEWLPNAVALFPYMQAVRFLTDYINGDTYYKTAYPGHNLVRVKAQLKLLRSIETRMSEIRATISG